MQTGKIVVAWMTFVVLGGLTLSPARAQGIAQGQTAFDNLIPGSDRSPGGMVNGGLGRAQDAVNPLGTIEITETEPVLDAMDEFRLEAIDTITNEISDFVVFLVTRFFQRAGVPTELTGELSGLLGSLGDLSGLADDAVDTTGDTTGTDGRNTRDPRRRREAKASDAIIKGMLPAPGRLSEHRLPK